MKRFLNIAVILFTVPIIAICQTNLSVKKENVIAQMNYCINSLTNIVHQKSMPVLEHESDQILNNLTMEQIIGLYEIKDFRVDLLDAVNEFEITEQERMLLRRIQSIQRDNMKWAALSNALDPTILLTGNGSGMGPQLAFQTLLTAARSAVEYKTMQGEQNIAELQAMWELRKNDMEKINNVRKQAFQLIFDLYEKYHLSEIDRLTEATANNFNIIISEPNVAKRLRLLKDNRSTYEGLTDYYYYLGMAFLDEGDYIQAKKSFNIYLTKYNNAPLLRYDEKSGCIALAILSNEPKLSKKEKEHYINMALKNMPNNSAAVLQCAIIYAYDFKDKIRALRLIRAGIDNPKASDPSILYMAAANLYPVAKGMNNLKSEIEGLFNMDTNISLDSYITYLINSRSNPWPSIHKIISFDNQYYRKWYLLWIGKYFNSNFHIVLPENIIFNNNDILVYYEKHTSDKLEIRQIETSYHNAVKGGDFDDVNCFKRYPNLKYLCFEELVPNQYYILKKDINYNQIMDDEWPWHSDVYDINSDDKEDIVNFCKKYAPESRYTEIACKFMKGEKIEKGESYSAKITFNGNSLCFTPHHSPFQNGEYIRIILANGINLLYKFDPDKAQLVPYFYNYDGKICFADKASKKEYWGKPEVKVEKVAVDSSDVDKPSGWSKYWSGIGNWFSNAWKSIAMWFNSDEKIEVSSE